MTTERRGVAQDVYKRQETIFALPGLGQLFYAAVMARDYPLIMGNLVLGAVLTLAGNMLADIGYGLADPRIRAQGKRQ